MEDSSYVDRTLDLYQRLRASHANTGICLQAYLRRTAKDVERLLPLGPAIRLVKGAYDEPKSVAFKSRKEVDANFLGLAVTMLRESRTRPMRVGLGTHDVDLIEQIAVHAAAAGVPKDAFEVQMLYGIRAGEQRRLAARRVQGPDADRVRRRVVPLVHAPARRAARERAVRRAPDAALVARVAALATAAPDVVAAWRGIDEGELISVRREVRRRTGVGTAEGIAAQLAAIAATFREVVDVLPERAFALPGGEGDWNVAQALGHAADARAGLAVAGALAAAGRWPGDVPEVVPGIPGAADATRDQLRRRIAASQRIVERSARTIAGHETDPCPLVHPLVGRLRCGEWLLFSGVHDLMHLAQLSLLEASLT